MHGGGLEGSWRGIFAHKNNFGAVMGLNALLVFIAGFNSKKFRWALFSLGFIFIFLLLKSDSMTALSALAGAFCLIPLFLLFKNLKPSKIGFIIILIYLLSVFSLFAFINSGELLNHFGRDSTLTGRTDLWQISLDYASKKPLLGYGYDSFWLGYEGKESSEITRVLSSNTPPFYAHNGWIDLLLELGIIGTVLFAISFITNLFYAKLYLRRGKESISLLPLIFFVFVFMLNLTEGTFLEYYNLIFIFYIAISFYIRNKLLKNE
jgi:O-antigen ligase